MVPGGFEAMSQTTRLTPLISLTMRVGTKKFWVPRQVLATLLALV
jgi:hypothetical protein